ncbi:MAG: DotU family type IV/VI secretion system protein [Gemmataceae bacterium]
MQDDIANLVQPIFSHALALRDRLEGGQPLNIDVEQATLKAMLGGDGEARRQLDYHADPPRSGATDRFLGARFALVCWLDELFFRYSPWSRFWNERTLEADLYGTNDRARLFWEQARLAESRPGNAALEVFHLCAILGFRGDLLDTPDRLQHWLTATQARLAKEPKAWIPPPELEPPVFVPPLRGRDRLQRMALACGFVILLLVPALTFLLMRRLGE